MGHFSRIDPDDFVSARRRPEASSRLTLQDNDLGRVEDAYVTPLEAPPSGHESSYQIVIPYHGLFAYCVGNRRWLMDPNEVLLISPGWDFHDEHPITEVGHAALLITPQAELLEEICHESGAGLRSVFRAPTRAASNNLRLLAHVLREKGGAGNPLQVDELLLRLMREVVNAMPSRKARESRVVCRAKEVLHSSNSERRTLADIAREVGVSPVYLTQEFTRAEGIPLYRYHLRLRLDRALAQLARCDDITGLALDLGFCSHSHFTFAFRSVFGLTPSEYRAAASLGRLMPALTGQT